MIYHSTEDEVEMFSDIKESLGFTFHKTERPIESYSIARSKEKEVICDG